MPGYDTTTSILIKQYHFTLHAFVLNTSTVATTVVAVAVVAVGS